MAFPPEYQPRGIVITINGEKLSLTRDQEELIYAWAKKKDTHYVQDSVYQENFMGDLKKLLPEKFKGITIRDIDFSTAYRLADEEKKMKEHEKERLRNLPKEEKKKLALGKKAEKERLKATVRQGNSRRSRSRHCKLAGRTTRVIHGKRPTPHEGKVETSGKAPGCYA